MAHSQLLEHLKAAHLQRKLSHALLFIGPKSIGKRTLANHLAAHVLNVSLEKLNSCADLITLELPSTKGGPVSGGKKSASTKQSVGIEDVLDFNRRISMSSFSIGYKVAIIDRLENLTNDAANAILKTLEEPPKNTLIIMLASRIGSVLPTILSRASNFHLRRANLKEVVDLVGSDVAKAELIFKISAGLPGKIIDMAADKKILDFAVESKNKINKLTKMHFGERMVWLNKQMSEAGNSAESNDLAKELLVKLAAVFVESAPRLLGGVMEAQLALIQNKISAKIALEHALMW